MSDVDLEIVDVDKPEDMNFILGQSHFIKTVEDIYEVIVSSVPGAKFGIAFCEASGACKVRVEGNDEKLMSIASKNAKKIGAGHSFIIFLKDCFPINVLNDIKQVSEVCRIFCATANPTKVVVARSKIDGKSAAGILGVIDGFSPEGIENSKDISWRKTFLRDIGYKR